MLRLPQGSHSSAEQEAAGPPDTQPVLYPHQKGQACSAAPTRSCDPTHREVRQITDLTTKLMLQIRLSKMCDVTSRELSHFFKQQHSSGKRTYFT